MQRRFRACAALALAGCGGPPALLPPRGPPGGVPAGAVGRGGGRVDRLWFATTGDTRPAQCDAGETYPRATVARLAASMKALEVQFALDLGDHMYVCNGSFAEARRQMDDYMRAVASGPSTFFLTMGNHECGRPLLGPGGGFGCFDARSDANFAAFLGALGRPRPYYAVDIETLLGLARLVVVADDSFDAAQAAWLEETLSDADARAHTIIIARHHPMSGGRKGNGAAVAIIERHRYSLLLAAHAHLYAHGDDHGGRAAIVGLGGAPSSWAPGFATVLQRPDGSLSFTLRDAGGDPIAQPWAVGPR